MVSRVEIQVDGRKTTDSRLRMAASQKAYHRTFGFLPLSAWMWHPERDTRWHRLRGRLGTAPMVYDEAQSELSEGAMQRVMQQRGYLDATVTHRTKIHKRKARVVYEVTSNMPRQIAQLRYEVADTTLLPLLQHDAPHRHLSEGQLLDRSRLEQERTRLTSMMRDHGLWDFDKEHVRFVADTLQGSGMVDLTVHLDGFHRPYTVRRVHFLTNFNVLTLDNAPAVEAEHTRAMAQPGYELTYTGEQCYLRDVVLMRRCHLIPGELYSEHAVRQTYSAFSQLHILRYVNLRLEEVGEEQLDCYIYLSPQNPHAMQFELDGTNTSGDLGFAASLTYQQRNAFRGSEAFTARLKGSYEALSGNVENLVNRNYSEYAGEASLDFPEFLMPFISDSRRRQSRATTVVKASYSRQSRPEYTRIIMQGGYGYKWSSLSTRVRHAWDVLDLSYVYLPEQSETFREIIHMGGPISYSAYTSHLIMSMGYTLYLGNNTQRLNHAPTATARDLWSLRVNPEVAGNVLMGVSRLAGLPRTDGQYVVFRQPFEQYARLDLDWSYSHYLTDRSRLAFHTAGGVAVPYGNSRVMPFEKRYYSGGANSVRGWSVRQLGPGRYGTAGGASADYFNQCGDLRLDLSMELRSRLFWKLESALFVDAGNVWTLRQYETQPLGQITGDFLRDIAASWGLGLRMVTDFVVLRLDWGFKAHDPAINADERWAIRHPFQTNHNTVHFAVGYPF